jgi:cobalt-zinc-cadmium efflux system outer membrane protein
MRKQLVANRRIAMRPVLVGIFLSLGFGCAVHHHHHFDEESDVASVPPAQPPAGSEPFLSSPPKSEAVAPASFQALESEKVTAPLAPPAAGASHSQGVKVTGQASDDPASRQRASGQPTAKASENPAKLTFDQAISATLTADPKIRAGFEVITQANADLLTSSLLPNPTLLVDGLFLPLRRITPDQPGGPPQTDVQIGYPIDWYLFGKRAAAMASAFLGVRQSEASFADLIRQRVTATATAFYTVLEAKALVELAREDVANLSRLAAAMRQAVGAGGKPVVDLNRVQLDLLRSQQGLRGAESTLVAARASLRALLGRSDAEPGFDVEGNLDAPLTAEPLPVDEAFAVALENRPDIRSLRLQVSKAQADARVEERKAYPQVTPALTYTHQFQQPIGAPDFDSWDVAVNVTLPLFDRNQGNRAKAESVAVQNSLNLQAGMVDLRAEIEQVVQEFRTAYKNAQAVAQEQLKLATDVRDSITKAHAAGGRPLIDVLDAQRNYRDTYRLYITSRANYWRSLYRFSSAIGKQVQPHHEQAH